MHGISGYVEAGRDAVCTSDQYCKVPTGPLTREVWLACFPDEADVTLRPVSHLSTTDLEDALGFGFSELGGAVPVLLWKGTPPHPSPAH